MISIFRLAVRQLTTRFWLPFGLGILCREHVIDTWLFWCLEIAVVESNEWKWATEHRTMAARKTNRLALASVQTWNVRTHDVAKSKYHGPRIKWNIIHNEERVCRACEWGSENEIRERETIRWKCYTKCCTFNRNVSEIAKTTVNHEPFENKKNNKKRSFNYIETHGVPLRVLNLANAEAEWSDERSDALLNIQTLETLRKHNYDMCIDSRRIVGSLFHSRSIHIHRHRRTHRQ